MVLLVFWDGVGIADKYVYRSELTTIYYTHPGQLGLFASKIRPNAFVRTLDKIFLDKNGTTANASIGEFVDRLFRRVQVILDMPMSSLKVNIRLYDKQPQFRFKYLIICRYLKSSSAKTKKSAEVPIAFYWKKTNTIYIQTEKLSTEVLAHEMGHVIIENYFIISPPEKISELLCHFVEKQVSIEF